MSLFEENFLTRQTAEFIPNLPPKEQYTPEDAFTVAYTSEQRILLTDSELVNLALGSVMVFDSESFINYSLIAFKHCDTGKYLVFEYPFDVGKLKWVMQHFLIIGFNSRNYDIPIVSLAIAGFNTRDLKEVTERIINGNWFPYQVEQSYKVKMLRCNHIDLIEVAPLQGSLKLYAGRLHCKRMQELPIDPDAMLTNEQKVLIKDYCLNDTDNTELVFNFLKPQLELRYTLSNTYNVDLRSKSDAQIAEAVIGTSLERLTGKRPDKVIKAAEYFVYQVPSFLRFHSPVLQQLLGVIRDTIFELDDTGKVKLPKSIKNVLIPLGNCTYQIGIGGLHSTEGQDGNGVAHKASYQRLLLDRDVSSYYPSIILNQGLYPTHLGQAFLHVYRDLVERRLNAKNSGDKITSDALKITINGTFGKLGNRYSILYSPQLLIQVTMSGQLCLLMLIDMIEHCGAQDVFSVLSANTDGILISCDPMFRKDLNKIVAQWEQITGFKTEEAEYRAVYAADVNNYFAIKKDGQIKYKGAYSERGSAGDSPLSRNPEAFICIDAAVLSLISNTPIERTIRTCKDIRKFVVVRQVRGGATKSGIYLGKTVRWYYSTRMKGEINYVKSGNKVPNSDGGRPLMEFYSTENGNLPDDLDYERYIDFANDILVEVGATTEKFREHIRFARSFASPQSIEYSVN